MLNTQQCALTSHAYHAAVCTHQPCSTSINVPITATLHTQYCALTSHAQHAVLCPHQPYSSRSTVPSQAMRSVPSPAPCLTRSSVPSPTSHAQHCKDTIPKIRKHIFPEKELRDHSPNPYIHVSLSDLYISTIGLPILLQENRWTDCGNI